MGAVAEVQSPKAVDCHGASECVLQLAEKFARPLTEGVDPAVPEVAYQQCAAELAKIHGSNRQPPWRVECSVGRKLALQIPIQVENIDEPIARTFHIVMVFRVLFRIGYKQFVVDVANPERRKSAGN